MEAYPSPNKSLTSEGCGLYKQWRHHGSESFPKLQLPKGSKGSTASRPKNPHL